MAFQFRRTEMPYFLFRLTALAEQFNGDADGDHNAAAVQPNVPAIQDLGGMYFMVLKPSISKARS